MHIEPNVLSMDSTPARIVHSPLNQIAIHIQSRRDCKKFISYKLKIIGKCIGKKTTLLQAEVSDCVSGLANVLFCGSAVHCIFFLTVKLRLPYQAILIPYFCISPRKSASSKSLSIKMGSILSSICLLNFHNKGFMEK